MYILKTRPFMADYNSSKSESATVIKRLKYETFQDHSKFLQYF